MIDIKPTARGFGKAEFLDINGIPCSIQKSSRASEDCIWLGCINADPQYLVPNVGWVRLEVPENTIFNTRMQLSQQQVAVLLPTLIKFVETGELQ